MISRMKREIAKLSTGNIRKDLRKYTIGPIGAWMYVWMLNIAKNNDIVANLALFIMILTFLCGCATALITRKNKMVFILFKVISIWIASLGLLSISYTTYYIFLKFNGILFVCATLFLYISIFVGVLIIVRNKVKQKDKIKKERNNKNKTILLGSTTFFTIGYFIIGLILNKSSQFMIYGVSIYLCLIICYILVACSTYYLVEYMISKKYINNKSKNYIL